METPLYEFDENILEEMYIYAKERRKFNFEGGFKVELHHRRILGHRIIVSNLRRDPDYVKGMVIEWFYDNYYKINDWFICGNKDNPPIFILEIFRHLKKFVDDIPDNETIESFGLNASLVRRIFSNFDYNDSSEIIYEKLDAINDLEDIISNEELFNLTELFNTIWPYIMPYLYIEPINENDRDKMWDFIALVQTSIEVVKKYKRQYYLWTSFYNFDYNEIMKAENSWNVFHLKDEKYRLVHGCFSYYNEYIENMNKKYESIHELLNDKDFGRYVRNTIIENVYTRSFYGGYLLFCHKNRIKPNFLVNDDFDVGEPEHMVEEPLKFEDNHEEPEIVDDLDAKKKVIERTHLPQLPHFTDEKLMKLFQRFKQYDLKYIKKNTREEDWLFVFGLKGDTPPEGFKKVQWTGKNKQMKPKVSPQKFVNFLEILGYKLNELYEDVDLLNRCFIAVDINNGNDKIRQKDFHYKLGLFEHVADYQELKDIVSEIGLCP